MNSFTHRAPTEIVFGLDSEAEVGRLVKKYGGSKVLIVYGGGSVVRSGLLERVKAFLGTEGIEYELFGGVQPNPLISKSKEGIKLALEFGADFLLAVGGGSVIDTAKTIAIGVMNPDVEVWDFFTGAAIVTKKLPVGAILTIPAAGSETSTSCVQTEDSTKTKIGFNTEMNYPAFAIMNPELAKTVPRFQLGAGATDIMMHTLDRYFNARFDNETTDEIAEAVLRVAIRNGKKAQDNPDDIHALSELMWAGSISHNGLTGLGGTRDFAVHMFGHEISGMFNLTHGASMAVAWTPVAKYVCEVAPERYARYARNVWGVTDEGSDEEIAQKGIALTTEYFRSLGMPLCAHDFLGRGFTEEEIEDLALHCCNYHQKKVGKLRVLDYEDMVYIFKQMNNKV